MTHLFGKCSCNFLKERHNKKSAVFLLFKADGTEKQSWVRFGGTDGLLAPGPWMGDEDWQLSKDSADAATV